MFPGDVGRIVRREGHVGELADLLGEVEVATVVGVLLPEGRVAVFPFQEDVGDGVSG